MSAAVCADATRAVLVKSRADYNLRLEEYCRYEFPWRRVAHGTGTINSAPAHEPDEWGNIWGNQAIIPGEIELRCSL